MQLARAPHPLGVILRTAPLLAFLSLAAPGWGKVIYVNKNAPGSVDEPTTWSTAALTVSGGLSAAAYGDEVWVAAATYLEDITLKRGVALYGGFSGTETARDARNPAANVTTLNGTGDTSVVTIPSSAGKGTLIDGFTITGGTGTVQTDGTIETVGGGIYCLGSAVISNNAITRNVAFGGMAPCGGAGQYLCSTGGGRGGGVFCAQGAPTIVHNIIRDNQAEMLGGGLYCGPGNALVDSNTIARNEAFSARGEGSMLGGAGAGICLAGSNALISRNTVDSNGMGGLTDCGGGIYVDGGNPTITGNSITANGYPITGGGLYLTGGTCSGNLIRGGRALKGGGVYASGPCSVVGNVIDACQGEGGGVYAGTSAIVASNLFTNNTSTKTGGGCLASGAEVINNTFVKNTAVDGGAIAIGAASVIANNIVVGNSSGIYAASGTAGNLTPYIRGNDVFSNTGYAYGGVLPSLTGTQGNTSADPLFASAPADDYRLSAGSPCIDAGGGADSFVPSDADGRPRLAGTTVDQGAYEFGAGPAPRILHVKAGLPVSAPDGAAWAAAYPTVQAAIDAAANGDEVWVASSTYQETITLTDGVSVYGGFAGWEAARGQRDPGAHPTVLDAAGTGTVVTVPASVVSAARLAGFTVRYGSDGGIRVHGHAVLARDIVQSNTAATGAGIWVGGSASVESCLVHGNSADGPGGGLAVSGTCTITNATIAANAASSGGAIAVLDSGSVRVVNTIVASNLSGIDGSGGTVALLNSDVYGNGGADFVGMTDPTGVNGNLARNPLFAAATAGDYRLAPGSPCIDTGDDSVVSPGGWDVDGVDRVLQAHVDMGAYEYRAAASPARILRVNRNASGAVRDGATWASAFHSVRDGIDAARPGDEVWVAPSAPAWPAYVGPVTLTNGVAVYGGFGGSEGRRAQRDPRANATVLDGNATDPVVTVPASVTEAATLDGFTVRNGFASSGYYGGGGVLIDGSAVISNNTITGNRADGVLDPYASSGSGGGIFVSGTARITGNTIADNSALNRGGGICARGASTAIANNVFSGNDAAFEGAAIFANAQSVTIAGNLIFNHSPFWCDTVTVGSDTADVRNNTITGNTGGNTLRLGVRTSARVSNNIIAHNGYTGCVVDRGAAVPVLMNNDVFDNGQTNYYGLPDPTGSDGNISQDPLFVNAAGGDYHLRAGSPCIDGGDDTVVTSGETDLDGRPRISGAHVDMGSYESVSTPRPTFTDVASTLRIAAGIAAGTPDAIARLSLEAPTNQVDILDALRIARKAAGLDANP